MTYVRYFQLAKLLLNNNELLPLFETLSVEWQMGDSLGVKHLNCSVSYSSDLDEKKFVVVFVDYFIKIPTKNSSFHALVINSAARSTLAELHYVYVKFATDV